MDRRIKKRINVLDLFSGIGGFSLGIEQSGVKIGWTGFSEIDNNASELYKRRFPNAEELGSVENVSYKKLKGKRIDLLTGGFPCQTFSIAGKRRGFKDTRGTMFFEIARILRGYIKNGKPIPCILLENVKGLLSHDSRRTFATIYEILTNLNYTIECQVVNTKWWLPQNRERIFIFGRYNGNPSGRKIFPIYGGSEKAHELQGQYTNTITARYEAGATGSYVIESEFNTQKGKLNQVGNIDTKGHNSLWGRVYNTNGISANLNAKGGGLGAKTGLYQVSPELKTYGIIPESDKPKGNWLPRERVLESENGLSRAISTSQSQHPYYKYGVKSLNKTLNKNQTKKLNKLKVDSSVSGTLTEAIGRGGSSSEYLTMLKKNQELTGHIRRLTPVECERLQGFPDNWTDGQSDTQRYKQCGNAVSVPVIKSIVERIYDL